MSAFVIDTNFSSRVGGVAIDVAFLIADHLKAKRRGVEPKDALLAHLRGESRAAGANA